MLADFFAFFAEGLCVNPNEKETGIPEVRCVAKETYRKETSVAKETYIPIHQKRPTNKVPKETYKRETNVPKENY